MSAGMNVLNFPEGKRPKATDVSQWYGVYRWVMGQFESITATGPARYRISFDYIAISPAVC